MTTTPTAEQLDRSAEQLIAHQVACWRQDIERLEDLIAHATGTTPQATAPQSVGEQALATALQAYIAFAAMRRGELGELSPEMEAVDAQARAAIATGASSAPARPTAWLATDLDGRGDVAFTKEEAKRRAGEGCTVFYPLYEPSDFTQQAAPEAPASAQPCRGCDPAEGFCADCRAREKASTQPVAAAAADLLAEFVAPAAQAVEARPELTVWEGPMPESNGRQNYTAVLHRKGAKGFDLFTDGFQFAHSEYPDRVRYEADCMRYLIGELAERPDILDYDADRHSGYAAPAASVDKKD